MQDNENQPDESDRLRNESNSRLLWRILLDFGSIALEDLEIASLLQRAVVQVARGTGIRHTKIMQYRPERGDLLAVAGIGWKPGFVGKTRFSLDIMSPPGRCIQTGQPVVIEDISATDDFRLSKALQEHGIVALVNVPIVFDGRTWGVLEVDSDEPGQFRASDIEFLQAMAHLLAGALQRVDAQNHAAAAAAEAASKSARAATLLSELQHRAKNNLQLVMSMLAREGRALRHELPQASERFERVMERVSAVAIAHDQLSWNTEATGLPGSATDLAGYLQALCSSLELSLGSRLVIEASLEPAALPFDRAVAVGLIVNELVTNAAKYAYPPGHEGGVVRVHLTADAGRAEAAVTVADDGQGMPAPETFVSRSNRPGGQGLSLIQLLARQLGGEIETKQIDHGTSTTVHFPLVV